MKTRCYRALILGNLSPEEAILVNTKWPGRKAKAGDSGVLAIGEGTKAYVTAWGKDRAVELLARGNTITSHTVKAVPHEPNCD